MDKQKMLDKIYEVIADKTVSEWCIVQTRENSCDICSPWEYCWHKQYYRKWTIWYDDTIFFDRWRITLEDWISCWERFWHKVIWYPVMIGDVLDWIYKTWSWKDVFHHFNTIAPNWVEMRKPIDNQPIECIEYIYNLLG